MKAKSLLWMAIALLAASNLGWAYAALDSGVSNTYREAAVDDECRTLGQLLRASAALAQTREREEVISAFQAAEPDAQIFEKEGAVWIGNVGLVFEGQRLRSIEKSVSPSLCLEVPSGN